MGLLDNFEKGLERAVNGAFAKTFKSGLQPVEITAALRRELDTKAAVISTGWSPLLKVFAKAPLTARSRPFSKLSSSPIGLLRQANRSRTC